MHILFLTHYFPPEVNAPASRTYENAKRWAEKGHKVTVFERESEPGGTLRTGIPAFRLPRDVIDSDIREIRKAGVRIRTNSTFKSVDTFFRRGYDAVLLAYGSEPGDANWDPAADLVADELIDFDDLTALLLDYGCAP